MGGDGCRGKRTGGKGERLGARHAISVAARRLATRPGWSEFGVAIMMRRRGMCPSCLELDYRHSTWCSLAKIMGVDCGDDG